MSFLLVYCQTIEWESKRVSWASSFGSQCCHPNSSTMFSSLLYFALQATFPTPTPIGLYKHLQFRIRLGNFSPGPSTNPLTLSQDCSTWRSPLPWCGFPLTWDTFGSTSAEGLPGLSFHHHSRPNNFPFRVNLAVVVVSGYKTKLDEIIHCLLEVTLEAGPDACLARNSLRRSRGSGQFATWKWSFTLQRASLCRRPPRTSGSRAWSRSCHWRSCPTRHWRSSRRGGRERERARERAEG